MHRVGPRFRICILRGPLQSTVLQKWSELAPNYTQNATSLNENEVMLDSAWIPTLKSPLCSLNPTEPLQLGYRYHWHTDCGCDPGKQDILRLVKGISSLCCLLVKLFIFTATCNSWLNHAVINRGKTWLARVLIVSCIRLCVSERSVLLVEASQSNPCRRQNWQHSYRAYTADELHECFIFILVSLKCKGSGNSVAGKAELLGCCWI